MVICLTGLLLCFFKYLLAALIALKETQEVCRLRVSVLVCSVWVKQGVHCGDGHKRKICDSTVNGNKSGTHTLSQT